MLTDVRCRNAKAGDKPTKLGDSGGLYLYVTPTGFKSWRMKYRYSGKEKRLTFGAYPEISIAEARDMRDAARRLLREGIDPAIERKQRKAARQAEALNTFRLLAENWHAKQKPHWAPRYADQVLARFENDVFPKLGALPVTDITVPLVLEVLQAVERRGSIETAHRLRQHMSDIFVTAIAAGIATADPAGVVRKALSKNITGRRPAVRTIDEARAVLKKVEAERAYKVTKLASRLLALTAARPGVVRLAAPKEFEGLGSDAPIWRIPAAKMKLTAERKRDVDYEFIIPLSRQAVEVVGVALEAFGTEKVLFPGVQDANRPISDSTLSKLYRTAGYRGVHVPHGWRSTFSTIMNELAAVENRVGDRAIIDLMLAHVPQGVEPIYNRAGYMPRRRELGQEWADMLMKDARPAAELLTKRS